MRSSLIIAALGGLLTLAGCGIKGDLYVPEVPEFKPQGTPAATPAGEAAPDTAANPPPTDGDDNNLAPLQPR
ncbi:MAG: lipoprotein [Azoarcus sp.]|nr:lipoprotein [Azoarcus sp.]